MYHGFRSWRQQNCTVWAVLLASVVLISSMSQFSWGMEEDWTTAQTVSRCILSTFSSYVSGTCWPKQIYSSQYGLPWRKFKVLVEELNCFPQTSCNSETLNLSKLQAWQQRVWNKEEKEDIRNQQLCQNNWLEGALAEMDDNMGLSMEMSFELYIWHQFSSKHHYVRSKSHSKCKKKGYCQKHEHKLHSM